MTILTDLKIPFASQLLKIHGIDESMVFSPDPEKIYLLDRCYISMHSFSGFEHVCRDLIDLMELSVHEMDDNPEWDLYVPRRNVSRSLRNEDEIAEYLLSRDFIIADFNNMDVLEQIKYIRGARTIVFNHGAATANCIYASHRPFNVIECFTHKLMEWTVNHLQAKNCNYTAIKAECAKPQDFWEPAYLDLPLLERALDTVSHQFRRNTPKKTASPYWWCRPSLADMIFKFSN